jgi:hypothetical protein
MLPDNYQSLRAAVIGSYNTDLVIWCDAIPVKGESIFSGDFEMFSGGRGANCAVAAARAGCRVKFAGAQLELGPTKPRMVFSSSFYRISEALCTTSLQP